jgi:hypothetical protein
MLTTVVTVGLAFRTIQHERRTQLASMKAEFFKEVLDRRLDTYADVLRTLGAVRDVAGPHSEHHAALKKAPEKLLPIADELIIHLYGPPGLVMSMETRNQIFKAWEACQLFNANPELISNLTSEFFQARRELRSDLETDDTKGRFTITSTQD